MTDTLNSTFSSAYILARTTYYQDRLKNTLKSIINGSKDIISWHNTLLLNKFDLYINECSTNKTENESIKDILENTSETLVDINDYTSRSIESSRLNLKSIMTTSKTSFINILADIEVELDTDVSYVSDALSNINTGIDQITNAISILDLNLTDEVYILFNTAVEEFEEASTHIINYLKELEISDPIRETVIQINSNITSSKNTLYSNVIGIYNRLIGEVVIKVKANMRSLFSAADDSVSTLTTMLDIFTTEIEDDNLYLTNTYRDSRSDVQKMVAHNGLNISNASNRLKPYFNTDNAITECRLVEADDEIDDFLSEHINVLADHRDLLTLEYSLSGETKELTDLTDYMTTVWSELKELPVSIMSYLINIEIYKTMYIVSGETEGWPSFYDLTTYYASYFETLDTSNISINEEYLNDYATNKTNAWNSIEELSSVSFNNVVSFLKNSTSNIDTFNSSIVVIINDVDTLINNIDDLKSNIIYAKNHGSLIEFESACDSLNTQIDNAWSYTETNMNPIRIKLENVFIDISTSL